MSDSATKREGNEGMWNTIRETIVCSMVDRNGKEFLVRLLVDTGATVSSIPAYTLYYTKGKWDCEAVKDINISGVNSQSVCNLICHAPIKPGRHLSKEFKEKLGITDKYELNVDFLVLKGPTVHTTYKRELPGNVIAALKESEGSLADPDQITARDSMLYIHGIIGVKAIGELKRTNYKQIPGTDMTLCTTKFGELLFGTLHIVKDKEVETQPPLNDYVWCTEAMWYRGLHINMAGLKLLENSDRITRVKELPPGVSNPPNNHQ